MRIFKGHMVTTDGTKRCAWYAGKLGIWQDALGHVITCPVSLGGRLETDVRNILDLDPSLAHLTVYAVSITDAHEYPVMAPSPRAAQMHAHRQSGCGFLTSVRVFTPAKRVIRIKRAGYALQGMHESIFLNGATGDLYQISYDYSARIGGVRMVKYAHRLVPTKF
jgi:hypothetical protein